MSNKTQKNSRGLVLRTTNFSEADRFCSILTPELGLIDARARGARRSRSGLMLGTEFLTLGDYQLFDYKGRYTINSADLVYTFPKVKADIERLTCASHLAELLQDLLLPDEASGELYELMARAMAALERDQPEPLAVVHACEIRLMRLSGYGLDLAHCAECGRALPPDEAACFDFERMGLVCFEHRPKPPTNAYRELAREASSLELSGVTLAAIDWFSTAPLDRLFQFESQEVLVSELGRFTRQYLAWNLDKYYTKLNMLNQF